MNDMNSNDKAMNQLSMEHKIIINIHNKYQ